MIRSVATALIIIALSCFTLARANHPRQGGGVEAKLDQFLDKLPPDAPFSGAVLVAKGEKIIFQKGYGWEDAKRSSRVRVDTRFYIASISKQFAAAAILKLEEQGRLGAKDSISKYFKDAPEDKAQITIHQLLTHTSGMAQNYAADGIVDREAAVKAILKKPLKGSPGEGFRYSNDGYNLLAALVEIASGQSYESYLRRHLLRPAGMSDTGFWGEPVAGGRPIARTLREINAEVKLPNWGFRGATGMYSTVGDLHKWRLALLGDRVLKRGSREKLLTPYVSTSRGGYGYGWFVSKTNRGDDVIWTAGAEDFGHNAILKTYKDGTVIIVASNAGNISGAPARDIVSAELERLSFETGARGQARREILPGGRPSFRSVRRL